MIAFKRVSYALPLSDLYTEFEYHHRAHRTCIRLSRQNHGENVENVIKMKIIMSMNALFWPE